jgi:hypothetical protein
MHQTNLFSSINEVKITIDLFQAYFDALKTNAIPLMPLHLKSITRQICLPYAMKLQNLAINPNQVFAL